MLVAQLTTPLVLATVTSRHFRVIGMELHVPERWDIFAMRLLSSPTCDGLSQITEALVATSSGLSCDDKTEQECAMAELIGHNAAEAIVKSWAQPQSVRNGNPHWKGEGDPPWIQVSFSDPATVGCLQLFQRRSRAAGQVVLNTTHADGSWETIDTVPGSSCPDMTPPDGCCKVCVNSTQDEGCPDGGWACPLGGVTTITIAPNPPSVPPPPPPPPLSLAVVTMSFVAEGDVAEYDVARRIAIKDAIARSAGVASEAVLLYVVPSSVLISAHITVANATAAESIVSSLANGIFSSPGALQTALHDASVSVHQIMSPPTRQIETGTDAMPPVPPGPPPAGEISSPAAPLQGTLTGEQSLSTQDGQIGSWQLAVIISTVALAFIVACAVGLRWLQRRREQDSVCRSCLQSWFARGPEGTTTVEINHTQHAKGSDHSSAQHLPSSSGFGGADVCDCNYLPTLGYSHTAPPHGTGVGGSETGSSTPTMTIDGSGGSSPMDSSKVVLYDATTAPPQGSDEHREFQQNYM